MDGKVFYMKFSHLAVTDEKSPETGPKTSAYDYIQLEVKNLFQYFQKNKTT